MPPLRTPAWPRVPPQTRAADRIKANLDFPWTEKIWLLLTHLPPPEHYFIRPDRLFVE